MKTLNKMLNKKTILIGFLLVFVLSGGFIQANAQDPSISDSNITSFEQCAGAGYPVTLSYPRQCRTPDGSVFVEGVVPSPSPTPAPSCSQISLNVEVDENEYKQGETLTGNISITNSGQKAPLDLSLGLYKKSQDNHGKDKWVLFWQRSAKLNIPEGTKTISLDKAFTFSPTIPFQDFVLGKWKLKFEGSYSQGAYDCQWQNEDEFNIHKEKEEPPKTECGNNICEVGEEGKCPEDCEVARPRDRGGRYGVTSYVTPRDWSPFTEAGADWLSFKPRIYWADVEDPVNNPGKYEFIGPDLRGNKPQLYFDEMLDKANKLGISYGIILHSFSTGTPRPWKKWDDLGGQYVIENDYPGTRLDGTIDPDMEQAWVNFVKKVVERYDGDSDFGCVVPEPDCYVVGDKQFPIFDTSNPPKVEYYQATEEWATNWWMDDTNPGEKYVNHLELTYNAIKEIDPNAKVLVAGLTTGWTRFFAFVDGYLKDPDANLFKGNHYTKEQFQADSRYKEARNGWEYIFRYGKNYFDVVDVHLYEEKDTFIEGKIKWLVDMMRRYGYQKPIWAKEGGGPFRLTQEEINDCLANPANCPPHGDPSFGVYTDKENAEYVIKLFSLAFSSGAERYTFWGANNILGFWGEGPFGNMHLIDVKKGRKASFYTYQLMTSKLKGFSSVEKLNLGTDNRVIKYIVNSKPVIVAWNNNGATIDLSKYFSGKNVKITHIITELDANNNPIYRPDKTVPANSIPIGETPIFVEAQ